MLRMLLVSAAVAGVLAGAAGAETRDYVVLASGENVGFLKVDATGANVAIDYAVDNNGRGPKAKEQIVLGADGLPVDWKIQGQTLFGSNSQETFSWKAGEGVWESQTDSGKGRSAKAFYAPADASPWYRGLYANALARTADKRADVLPSGAMRLTELKTLKLGEGRKAVSVTIHELAGIDLHPSLVALDDKGDLFALPDDGIVRAGYEADFPVLQAAARDIALEQAKAAQAKLAHRFETPVRIRNVRIFDPKSGSVGELSQVVVFRDRIAAIEPEKAGAPAPAGETVIDGQGGTLAPGLHDNHHHSGAYDTGLFALAAGITSVRDQGSVNDFLLNLDAMAEAGEVAYPRIVRSGMIEGRSPYSVRMGRVAATLEEALDSVRWYADHGYRQIKIYNSAKPEWVKPLAAEAHRLGMGVTGHVPAFSTADRAAAEGYDDIAHINQLVLNWVIGPQEDTRTILRLTALNRIKDVDLAGEKVRTTIGLMQKNEVALDSTISIIERMLMSRAGQVSDLDRPYLDHTPIGYQRLRRKTIVSMDKPGEPEAFAASFQRMVELLKVLDDSKIQLLPGTDDATGFLLHRELELYVKAGIPAGRTLALATLESDRYLGRDQSFGSIERGKYADFLLVDGDPTKDIGRIRQIRMTMKGGVAYYPAEIYEHLGIRPFAAAPPVTAAR